MMEQVRYKFHPKGALGIEVMQQKPNLEWSINMGYTVCLRNVNTSVFTFSQLCSENTQGFEDKYGTEMS